MKSISLCIVMLLASSLPCLAGPPQELAKLLVSSSKAANPSLSFLQGLGKIGDGQLSAAQLGAAMGSAQGQGLNVHPALRQILTNMASMTIQGSQVSIQMRQRTSVDLAGKGYVHLAQSVRLRVSHSMLSGFRGLKLSNTAGSFRKAPKSIVFAASGGVPIARINLGLFGGTRVIKLVSEPKSASLNTPGLSGLLQVG